MDKRPPIAYEVLRQQFLKIGVTHISYEELLWTNEWLNFREGIKNRDNFTCGNCGKSEWVQMTDEEFEKAKIESGYGKYFDLLECVFLDSPTELWTKKNSQLPSRKKWNKDVRLEVHHKYYIWNYLPWEYERIALTTLCDKCHEIEHYKQKEIYLDQTLKTMKQLIYCHKCNGHGYIPEYKHVQSGICFNCGGLGGIELGTDSNQFHITTNRLF